jgi:hypothetical protein
MTINFPVSSSNTSPDLKFMPQAKAVMLDTMSQTMKIICQPSSQTGEFKVGSFDGGGWTVLTAEAVLDDNTKVMGRLLVSNGETDIRIPKRDINSKIAEVWLKTYGNPAETDDKDTSRDNSNNGDGLSAYEEYRGVISEKEFGTSNPNKFGRLDPLKKELGVKVDKTELPVFSEGVRWFENGSGLKVIRFNEREVGGDRRLNKNSSTAHIYDQFALVLYKGLLDHTGGALGSVFTPTNAPDIPANTMSVVIDVEAIQNEYNTSATKERPTPLPFTLSDFIANVTAHELGHGVNVWHHGQVPNLLSPMKADFGPPFSINAYNSSIKKWTLLNPPSVRIFNRNGVQISLPYTMSGPIGQKGNTESGDLNCFMAYVPYCSWSYTTGADGAWIFNEVPMVAVGRKVCTSASGTGINTGIIYFGDAQKGNCLSQIKLKP